MASGVNGCPVSAVRCPYSSATWFSVKSRIRIDSTATLNGLAVPSRVGSPPANAL
jgi:hypothetical protein